MAAVIKKGTEKQREERYKIEGKGLFIFATANKFKYEDNLKEEFLFEYRQYEKKEIIGGESESDSESSSSRENNKDNECSEDETSTCDPATTRDPKEEPDTNQDDTTDPKAEPDTNQDDTTDPKAELDTNQDDTTDPKEEPETNHNSLKASNAKINSSDEPGTDLIIDKLISAFGLKSDADNLMLYGEKKRETAMTIDAMSSESEDTKFKKLIETISQYTDQIKPSFLIFVLASGAKENGEFLLSSNDQKDCKNFCNKKHKFSGRCTRRRISDLVRAIQDAEGKDGLLFTKIPKIFLIQTVSGKERSERLGKDVSLKGRIKDLDPDAYTPVGSDTFVFYAHTEHRVDWVNKNGFYLLDRFCDMIESLSERTSNSDEGDDMLEKLIAMCGKEKPVREKLFETATSALETEYEMKLNWERESLCNAWFDNVCTTVAATITDFLDQKLDTDHKHLRAYMSSTMRYRVSMLDILRSQQTS
ncbi:uncharacterized protein [Watersipora subatra]|uniref:uncharacterized protein n=1 Tax=Watersipora subatra TaxID=2589382 RepID=UPI00355C7ED6